MTDPAPTLTPLDGAHAAMEAAPDDDAARLRFFERLADSELFLLLTKEPQGENIEPELFELSDHSFVLLFDREERLTGFTGRPAPYAALSGRVVAGLLAGQGIGLGVNLEVAPSSILIPPEAVDWLVDTLGNAPQEAEEKIAEFTPPKGLPEALLGAIDAKLASAVGMARMAYLVGVRFESGGQGHMLGFVDALPHAESALAKAAAEALTFSGIEAGAMDVAFFRASDAAAGKLAKVGLRFDLPQPDESLAAPRPAPGSDPSKPPILR
ncbi:SseB family protein [Litorivita sp. NS0012-18]|uniref:SseB family protein n=1 Tax=Litorivita sp. NS0012-18 TaxID=3127655 RepID=UPI00310AFDD3